MNEQNYKFKRHAVTLHMEQSYWNAGGLIAKAATTAAYRIRKIPFFLFCEYDFKSKYANGFKLIPIIPNDVLYQSYFVNMFVYNRMDWSKTINYAAHGTWANFNVGDLILYFRNDVGAYDIFLRIYGEGIDIVSLLRNTGEHKKYRLESIAYRCDVDAQLRETIYLVQTTPVGAYSYSNVQPYGYKSTDYAEPDLIVIPFGDLAITQYNGLYSYMLFDTDKITMDLTFKY